MQRRDGRRQALECHEELRHVLGGQPVRDAEDRDPPSITEVGRIGDLRRRVRARDDHLDVLHTQGTQLVGERRPGGDDRRHLPVRAQVEREPALGGGGAARPLMHEAEELGPRVLHAPGDGGGREAVHDEHVGVRRRVAQDGPGGQAQRRERSARDRPHVDRRPGFGRMLRQATLVEVAAGELGRVTDRHEHEPKHGPAVPVAVGWHAPAPQAASISSRICKEADRQAASACSITLPTWSIRLVGGVQDGAGRCRGGQPGDLPFARDRPGIGEKDLARLSSR